jgi:hypothetical protein
LLSILIVTILLAQGCSMSKPASLEEAGTPPQASMEAELPKEEPPGQYAIQVSCDQAPKTEQPVLLKISLVNTNKEAPPVLKEKESSLVMVSKDGSDFQRFFPKQVAPGKLECQATLVHGGLYNVCLQFTRADDKNFAAVTSVQLGKNESKGSDDKDKDKDNDSKQGWKKDTDKPKTVDGYEFIVRDCPENAGPTVSMPTFRITKEVRPVSNIEPMNNKPGYAVVVNENGDRFYRTIALGQPAANKLFQQPVMFHVIVPDKGNYKIWAQFKIDGALHTVPFTFQVQ